MGGGTRPPRHLELAFRVAEDPEPPGVLRPRREWLEATMILSFPIKTIGRRGPGLALSRRGRPPLRRSPRLQRVEWLAEAGLVWPLEAHGPRAPAPHLL